MKAEGIKRSVVFYEPQKAPTYAKAYGVACKRLKKEGALAKIAKNAKGSVFSWHLRCHLYALCVLCG